MHTKAILSLLLLISIMIPSPAFCFKKRDAIMITSGVVVTGLGITFVIKSGKKKKEPQTSQVIIQPWFPQAQQRVDDVFRP